MPHLPWAGPKHVQVPRGETLRFAPIAKESQGAATSQRARRLLPSARMDGRRACSLALVLPAGRPVDEDFAPASQPVGTVAHPPAMWRNRRTFSARPAPWPRRRPAAQRTPLCRWGRGPGRAVASSISITASVTCRRFAGVLSCKRAERARARSSGDLRGSPAGARPSGGPLGHLRHVRTG